MNFILILTMALASNNDAEIPALVDWDKVITVTDSFPAPEPEGAYDIRQVILDDGTDWQIKAIEVKTILAPSVDTTYTKFCWLLEGQGFAMIGDAKNDLQSGSIFKIQKNRTYAFTNTDINRSIILELMVKE